jgi:anaerobic selenocysteine-containing dehydrogenase
MTTIRRRQFIQILAGAGVAVASGGWFTERLLAMVEEGALPSPRGPGAQRWVPSLCRLCPAGCGIRVRLVDDLPVGLEGNRSDPVSAGGLCPAGLAGLQDLVHPDRVRTPLRRNGPRGSGKWSAISWDEGLEEVATALRRLRSQGRPEAFGVLERGDSELTGRWLKRVMQAFGSPNLITPSDPSNWRAAWAYMAGRPAPPVADLANSDFILSFGHELFETDGHPVWQSKVWGRMRAPAAPPGVSVAYVGPRVSPSAIRADLRVAVRPGTEAVLALGLAGILVMEDRLDRRFVDRWTTGFYSREEPTDPERQGFEGFVRRRYSPEDVSRITGASLDEIFRLGRALGRSQRPVAIVGQAPLSGENGLAAAAAIVALNLSLGAVGRPGGYVAAGTPPLGFPEPVVPDAVARRGLSAPRVDRPDPPALAIVERSPARLAANLVAGKPYPLEVLLIHGVNPVHAWPGGKTFESALATVPLVVAVGSVLDETARWADLVLPEATFLESWQLLPPALELPFEYVGLQQPAVESLYQSRSFEDIWFAVARRVGEPVASTVPAGAYAEWLPSAASGLFRSGRGTIASSVHEQKIADFMQARGWRAPGPRTPESFWEELKGSGSWLDASRAERSPAQLLGAGERGRFEFWPSRFERDVREQSGSSAPRAALYEGRSGRGGIADGTAHAGDYPLRLLLFDTNTLWEGRTALTPLMLELSGFRENIAWDSWVEIHPETAHRNRIRDGDRVRVESPAGALLVRARIAPIVPPAAVAISRGLGHEHFGRFANGVGVNPLVLLPATVDPWTGSAVLAAQVRLTPVRA